MHLYKKGSSLPPSLPSHRKIGVWSNIQIYLVLPTSLVSLYCGGFKCNFGKLTSENSHTLNASSFLFSCYVGIIMLSPYFFKIFFSVCVCGYVHVSAVTCRSRSCELDPGAGVRCCCELPDLSARNGPWVFLLEQSMLFTCLLPFF